MKFKPSPRLIKIAAVGIAVVVIHKQGVANKGIAKLNEMLALENDLLYTLIDALRTPGVDVEKVSAEAAEKLRFIMLVKDI